MTRERRSRNFDLIDLPTVEEREAIWALYQTKYAGASPAARLAARLTLAATGVCPDCGGVMEIDPACEIDEPWIDTYYGRIERRRKIAPAALCMSCECCVDLSGEKQ